MILTRRSFFRVLAAPAIVRAASIMPVKALIDDVGFAIEYKPVFESVDISPLLRRYVEREMLRLAAQSPFQSAIAAQLQIDKGDRVMFKRPLQLT